MEGLLKKDEHRTSNVQHRILNGKRLRNRSPELPNDILKETEEELRGFALIGILEYWNVGIMG